MLVLNSQPKPSVALWKEYVTPQLQTIASHRLAHEMPLVGKSRHYSDDEIREFERTIRRFVPCGLYEDYDGNECKVLGVAQNVETREFYAVLPRAGFAATCILLSEFLAPVNSSIGFKQKLGIRYIMRRPCSPLDMYEELAAGTGVQPGYARLWKDPSNRYAILGTGQLVGGKGNEKLATLYVPLYPPHAGNLILRPFYWNGDGFFDPIRDRTTKAGEPYEGPRFIAEGDAELPDVLSHLTVH